MNTKTSVIQSAKEYAAGGFSIIPLRGPHENVPNPGKRPVNSDWTTRPFITPDQVETEFKAPNNVGVRLGEPSSVMGYHPHVIDVDIRDPSLQHEVEAELDRILPGWRDYPWLTSGSGKNSRHIFIFCNTAFPKSRLARNTKKFICPDGKLRNSWEIDLLGTGNQTVLPPSQHIFGGYYEWQNPIDFDTMELMGEPFPILSASQIVEVIGSGNSAERSDVQEEEDLLDMLESKPIEGLVIHDIREAVWALDVEEWCNDRETWLKIGMALHHQLEGDVAGLEIWDEWSAQSPKYEKGACQGQWDTFKRSRAGQRTTTFRTVLNAIKKLKTDFPEEWRRISRITDPEEMKAEVVKYEIPAAFEAAVCKRLRDLYNEVYDVSTSVTDMRREIKRCRAARESLITKGSPLEERLSEYVLVRCFRGGETLLRHNKNYWMYDAGKTRLIEEGVVRKEVKKALSNLISKDQNLAQFKDLAADLRKSGKAENFAHLIGNVTRLVADTVTTADPDPLNLTKWRDEAVLNCLNGEIHFEGSGLVVRKHDPANRFTRQVAAVYDPEAKCPIWDETLREIFSDRADAEDIIRHLHEQLGYVAQDSRPERIFMLFQGSGANGKSLIADVFGQLIGAGGVAHKTIAEFGDRGGAHVWASLVGKSLLIDDDFKKGERLPDGPLKIMSEGKQVTANPKFGSDFEFFLSCVPLILSNHMPRTSDNSFGLEDRAFVYTFTHTFSREERDTHLRNKIIENEMSGILNRLVEGFQRFQERGGFQEPTSCVKAKELWLTTRNPISVFVHDNFTVTDSRDHLFKRSELWRAYKLWCEREGVRMQSTRQGFFEEVVAITGDAFVKYAGEFVARGLVPREDSEIFTTEELELFGASLVDATDDVAEAGEESNG